MLPNFLTPLKGDWGTGGFKGQEWVLGNGEWGMGTGGSGFTGLVFVNSYPTPGVGRISYHIIPLDYVCSN